MTGHEIAETGMSVLMMWLSGCIHPGQRSAKGVTHVHRSLAATADTYGTNVFGVQEDDCYSAAKIFSPMVLVTQ